jgi:ubiquitin carboxyl-terminal hydrolase 5/13
MPKEAEVEEEPELDMGMVNTLVANGVPELAAKHAVYNTGG